MIRHEGGKWVLRTSDGRRVLGRHDTRDEALAQERAIYAGRKGGDRRRQFAADVARREKAGEIVSSMFPSQRTYPRVPSPNGRPRTPFVVAPHLGGLVTKEWIDIGGGRRVHVPLPSDFAGGRRTVVDVSGRTVFVPGTEGDVASRGKEDEIMRRKEADDYARLGPKRDGKYTVVMGGKVRGRHRTREEAVAQVQAINLSKLREEGRRDVPPEPKAAAAGSYVVKDAPQMEIWEGIRTR